MSQGPCSFPRPAQPWGSGHLGSHTPQAPQPSVPTHQRTSCQRFSPGARRPAMPCPAGRPLANRRGAHGGGGSDCSRSVPSARSPSWGAARGLAGPGGAAGVPPVRRPGPPRPAPGAGSSAAATETAAWFLIAFFLGRAAQKSQVSWKHWARSQALQVLL